VARPNHDERERCILHHSESGSALRLFRAIGNTGVEYLGEYVYDSHQYVRRYDVSGQQRKLIEFTSVPPNLDARLPPKAKGNSLPSNDSTGVDEQLVRVVLSTTIPRSRPVRRDGVCLHAQGGPTPAEARGPSGCARSKPSGSPCLPAQYVVAALGQLSEGAARRPPRRSVG
jgi:hypothetical protein